MQSYEDESAYKHQQDERTSVPAMRTAENQTTAKYNLTSSKSMKKSTEKPSNEDNALRRIGTPEENGVNMKLEEQ